MKTINKILILLSVGLFGAFSNSWAADEPVFEIANKFNKPILVTVRKAINPSAAEPMYSFVWAAEVPAGGRKALLSPGENLNSNLRLFIDFDVNKNTSKPASPTTVSGLKSLHDFVYDFSNASGKTKYVTFNPGKSSDRNKWLYPQTGTFLGLSGKTDSGYSLKNNIKDANIKPLVIFEGKLP